MGTTIHSEPSGMDESKRRSVGSWLLAGGLLGLIGIVLAQGAAWATHESGQLSYRDPSEFHGTNASQSLTDSNGNVVDAIMGGGRDTVLAGDQEDKICGSGDPDDLRGQAESDRISGGQGADQLFGAEGGMCLTVVTDLTTIATEAEATTSLPNASAAQ